MASGAAQHAADPQIRYTYAHNLKTLPPPTPLEGSFKSTPSSMHPGAAVVRLLEPIPDFPPHATGVLI